MSDLLGQSRVRPRLYCAIAQPVEGDGPVTAITTVHKDDFAAVREELDRLAEAALDADERALLGVCVDRYIADLRQACAEDQGDPDGAAGTVGYTTQEQLRALKEKLDAAR